jgi:BlaI family penicillinase repressor
MNQEIPRISDAEWEVMEVLWRRSPLTANEVIEELSHVDWKPNTIRTLLNRLVEKHAIEQNRTGKLYSFSPLVQKEECRRAEAHSFIKRIYGGAFKPLIVHFLKEEKLSPEDIEEIRNILDEKS